MEQLSEIWTIVDEIEYKYIWDKIYEDFHFKPNSNIDGREKTFRFKMPFDVYDVSETKFRDEDEKLNELMISIFVECMENDPFMYALDWQHSSLRYNPRIKHLKENPTFIFDNRYDHGGYNVYFPEFYPNGDYYFFTAFDFRWGYFTHPWRMKLWVFGKKLMKEIEKYSEVFCFKKINKECRRK